MKPETLEIKKAMEQIKSSVESLNNRISEAEERVSELEDISFNSGGKLEKKKKLEEELSQAEKSIQKMKGDY